MRELVEVIAKALVDHPEEVVVTEMDSSVTFVDGIIDFQPGF